VVDGKLLGPGQPDQLDEHAEWEKVVAAVPHLGITPFEAKALYAFPLLRQLAEAAILLVRNNMDLPGYVVLADGIEALGRCLTGCQEENSGSGRRLREGLERLELRDDGQFQTLFRLYSVADCVRLRNFTTHGGTTPHSLAVLDRQLTVMLLDRYAAELTDYWVRLGDAANAVERDLFAAARIRPLFTANQPVFVEDMFTMMTRPGAEAGQGLRL